MNIMNTFETVEQKRHPEKEQSKVIDRAKWERYYSQDSGGKGPYLLLGRDR